MVNEKNKIHVNTINYWRHYRGKNNFKRKKENYPIILQFTRKLYQRKF